MKKLEAPECLFVHVKLVGEALEEIICFLSKYNLPIDYNFARLGVVLHDAGKIVHPLEVTESGNKHEAEGNRLLLENRVALELARCCISHAHYDKKDCSIEELLVALSDSIWKGTRVENLELKVVDKIAALMGKERWDIFLELDDCFEAVASSGDKRLERSKNSSCFLSNKPK
ncbi:MAG: hypothetical protein NUV86_12210 [Candidatus Scalindua sp.]|nr:hypothetical protein [Candidatus Scalindua sp.]